MNRFIMHRFAAIICASGLFSLSQSAMAAAFQLFEQDGVGTGNYHAGYAALANDASTAYYNPAGITRIKNQQLVIAANNVLTDFKFSGNVFVNTIAGGFVPLPAVAQGGQYALIPALHYVAPLSDCLGFGLSIVVPFGLKTDYGISTPLRYAATETSVTVIDISPSLAWQVNEHASIGVGLDIERMKAEFDAVAVLADPMTDTTSENKAHDTAYGFHAGFLYQFNPDSRVGISYHSKVAHHLKGTSELEGPLAALVNDDNPLIKSRGRTSINLPAWTALSGYQRLNKQFALMGTAIYTQWNTFENIVIQNVASIDLLTISPSTTTVISPEHYRNSWNFSVGGDYYVNDCITLRAGLGFDQTPVRDEFRTVRLPDKNRYIIALGGHYQAANNIGIDAGWMHIFMSGEADINPPPSMMGSQEVRTVGDVKGAGDVFGLQVTWDMA